MLEFKTALGKASKIPAAAIEQQPQKLQDPEGFNSYGQVQQWLAQEWEIDASYPTAHQVVRYQLQSKLKIPRPHSAISGNRLQ